MLLFGWQVLIRKVRTEVGSLSLQPLSDISKPVTPVLCSPLHKCPHLFISSVLSPPVWMPPLHELRHVVSSPSHIPFQTFASLKLGDLLKVETMSCHTLPLSPVQMPITWKQTLKLLK